MASMQLVSLVISAALAYYVYTDSEGRGMNQIVWALVAFFFSLLGVIVYFIARKPKGTGSDDSTLDSGMMK